MRIAFNALGPSFSAFTLCYSQRKILLEHATDEAFTGYNFFKGKQTKGHIFILLELYLLRCDCVFARLFHFAVGAVAWIAKKNSLA